MSFLSADPINHDILTRSLALQREISKVDGLEGPGIGAQQVMPKDEDQKKFGPADPLPWVPDRVGSEFSRENNGVLIVGSSYNGFIEGYAQRSMKLDSYLEIRDLICRNKVREACELFIRNFEQQVMQPDRCMYYGPILHCLLQKAGIPHDRACLTDLCKASFVQQGKLNGDGTRLDIGHDGIVKKHWESWTRFLGCGRDGNNGDSVPVDWLWRRMQQCRYIVALGTIAEYGVLKVFHQKATSVQVTTRNGGRSRLNRSVDRDARWKYCYADSSRKLSHWLDTKDWWVLSDGKTNRRWNLLPVCHPSTYGKHSDVGYERTGSVLREMIMATSHRS